MRKIFAVVSMVLVLLLANVAWAAEAAGQGPDKITLRSRAEKSVKANLAITTLGVRVQSNNLPAAQEQVNAAVNAVVNALVANGISKEDIKTARFTVNSFNPDNKTQTTTYVVDNNVTVKIRDIGNVGNVLDAATEAGANQIQGINFVYENDAALKDELLKQAVVNGRKQASMVVAADGRSLGRLLDVNMYTVNTQVVDDMATMRAMAANSKIGSQVFSGDVVISAEMSLVFEIKP